MSHLACATNRSTGGGALGGGGADELLPAFGVQSLHHGHCVGVRAPGPARQGRLDRAQTRRAGGNAPAANLNPEAPYHRMVEGLGGHGEEGLVARAVTVVVVEQPESVEIEQIAALQAWRRQRDDKAKPDPHGSCIQ